MSKSDFQVMQIDTMLKHLTLAFRHCNLYNDIKEMRYNKENETVDVIYWGAMNSRHERETYKLEVNVACDSYAAIIHDVEQRVYKFFS